MAKLAWYIEGLLGHEDTAEQPDYVRVSISLLQLNGCVYVVVDLFQKYT